MDILSFGIRSTRIHAELGYVDLGDDAELACPVHTRLGTPSPLNIRTPRPISKAWSGVQVQSPPGSGLVHLVPDRKRLPSIMQGQQGINDVLPARGCREAEVSTSTLAAPTR